MQESSVSNFILINREPLNELRGVSKRELLKKNIFDILITLTITLDKINVIQESCLQYTLKIITFEKCVQMCNPRKSKDHKENYLRSRNELHAIRKNNRCFRIKISNQGNRNRYITTNSERNRELYKNIEINRHQIKDNRLLSSEKLIHSDGDQKRHVRVAATTDKKGCKKNINKCNKYMDELTDVHFPLFNANGDNLPTLIVMMLTHCDYSGGGTSNKSIRRCCANNSTKDLVESDDDQVDSPENNPETNPETSEQPGTRIVKTVKIKKHRNDDGTMTIHKEVTTIKERKILTKSDTDDTTANDNTCCAKSSVAFDINQKNRSNTDLTPAMNRGTETSHSTFKFDTNFECCSLTSGTSNYDVSEKACSGQNEFAKNQKSVNRVKSVPAMSKGPCGCTSGQDLSDPKQTVSAPVIPQETGKSQSGCNIKIVLQTGDTKGNNKQEEKKGKDFCPVCYKDKNKIKSFSVCSDCESKEANPCCKDETKSCTCKEDKVSSNVCSHCEEKAIKTAGCLICKEAEESKDSCSCKEKEQKPNISPHCEEKAKQSVGCPKCEAAGKSKSTCSCMAKETKSSMCQHCEEQNKAKDSGGCPKCNAAGKSKSSCSCETKETKSNMCQLCKEQNKTNNSGGCPKCRKTGKSKSLCSCKAKEDKSSSNQCPNCEENNKEKTSGGCPKCKKAGKSKSSYSCNAKEAKTILCQHCDEKNKAKNSGGCPKCKAAGKSKSTCSCKAEEDKTSSNLCPHCEEEKTKQSEGCPKCKEAGKSKSSCSCKAKEDKASSNLCPHCKEGKAKKSEGCPKCKEAKKSKSTCSCKANDDKQSSKKCPNCEKNESKKPEECPKCKEAEKSKSTCSCKAKEAKPSSKKCLKCEERDKAKKPGVCPKYEEAEKSKSTCSCKTKENKSSTEKCPKCEEKGKAKKPEVCPNCKEAEKSKSTCSCKAKGNADESKCTRPKCNAQEINTKTGECPSCKAKESKNKNKTENTCSQCATNIVSSKPSTGPNDKIKKPDTTEDCKQCVLNKNESKIDNKCSNYKDKELPSQQSSDKYPENAKKGDNLENTQDLIPERQTKDAEKSKENKKDCNCSSKGEKKAFGGFAFEDNLHEAKSKCNCSTKAKQKDNNNEENKGKPECSCKNEEEDKQKKNFGGFSFDNNLREQKSKCKCKHNKIKGDDAQTKCPKCQDKDNDAQSKFPKSQEIKNDARKKCPKCQEKGNDSQTKCPKCQERENNKTGESAEKKDVNKKKSCTQVYVCKSTQATDVVELKKPCCNFEATNSATSSLSATTACQACQTQSKESKPSTIKIVIKPCKTNEDSTTDLSTTSDQSCKTCQTDANESSETIESEPCECNDEEEDSIHNCPVCSLEIPEPAGQINNKPSVIIPTKYKDNKKTCPLCAQEKCASVFDYTKPKRSDPPKHKCGLNIEDSNSLPKCLKQSQSKKDSQAKKDTKSAESLLCNEMCQLKLAVMKFLSSMFQSQKTDKDTNTCCNKSDEREIKSSNYTETSSASSCCPPQPLRPAPKISCPTCDSNSEPKISACTSCANTKDAATMTSPSNRYDVRTISNFTAPPKPKKKKNCTCISDTLEEKR